MTEAFDADAITERYLKVRKAKANRAAAAKKDDDVFGAELTRLEELMGEFLANSKLDSAPSAHGTFYRQLEVLPSASDWTAFYNWIKENNAFQFLHKRITAKEVAAYMEEHKNDKVALPPGVAVQKKYVVRVRTASGTGEE